MAMLPSVRAPHCVSLDKQGVHADQPKTKSTDKPAETAAFSAGRDKKEHTALFQAERLSSWCHVKHSRGQTPELSRDQVKALVQVQTCCLSCLSIITVQGLNKSPPSCILLSSAPHTSMLGQADI